MKSVLISIQPYWVDLIASGKKTVEVRKTKPKLNAPFKVYIYCTQDKYVRFANRNNWDGNGNVIGEFVCDEIKMSLVGCNEKGCPSYWDILDGSCLTPNELLCYGEFKTLYGWHISDLVIYDEPKELSEFHKIGYIETKESVSWLTREEENSWQIKKPPQSWGYVEERSA